MRQSIFIPQTNPNKLEGDSITNQMEYKNKMYLLKMEHDKMKFILSLRACRPSFMLELFLEKIKLAKKMFVMQLE